MIEVYRNRPLARINGKQIKLSRTEYRILKALCMAGGRVVDIDLLLDMVMDGWRVPADKDLLRNRVHRLRKRIGVDFIETVRSTGYSVTDEVGFIG